MPLSKDTDDTKIASCLDNQENTPAFVGDGNTQIIFYPSSVNYSRREVFIIECSTSRTNQCFPEDVTKDELSADALGDETEAQTARRGRNTEHAKHHTQLEEALPI
jgi:hypothetical protein